MGVLACELAYCFLTWTAHGKTPETQKDKRDKKGFSGSAETQLQSCGQE